MSAEFFSLFPTAMQLRGTIEAQADYTGLSGNVKENFVQAYYSAAKKAAKRYSINPLIILAQAAIESGWGTSYMARNINNFFGITAYGSTNEFWKGQKYTSRTSGLPFRVYPSVEAGFMDFARLITSKYKEAAAVSNNVRAYARKIAQSPYISEANGDNRALYESSIIKNAEFILGAIKKASPQAAQGLGLWVVSLRSWQAGCSLMRWLEMEEKQAVEN